MKIFTFTKLGRTLFLSAVLAVGSLCVSGCAENNSSPCICDGNNNTGVALPDGDGGTLSYGGQTYRTVVIGGTRWMAENLNVVTAESWCYGEGGLTIINYDERVFGTLSSSEVQANCNKYGRLYTWAAAKIACPSGWKLPSRTDWDNLAVAVGGEKYYDSLDYRREVWGYAGKNLKSKSGWNDYHGESGNGTDNYGFSAIPGGAWIPGAFARVGETSGWWGATEYSDENAYYWYIDYNIDFLVEDNFDKNGGCSVRCIEN